MEFVDFAALRRGPDIELIFPGWKKGETVAFLSPHDDDVLLGAGYLLKAVLDQGGIPMVYIFCAGDAGYSTIEEKAVISGIRRQEAEDAYGALGIPLENLMLWKVPDFSLMPQVNRKYADQSGLFDEQVSLFRAQGVSRVVCASGYYEHWDHTAVFYMGLYTSPQAGDPILADLGVPQPVKTCLIYSVWGDFDPALGISPAVRADKAVLADFETEESLREAVQRFVSQRPIFQSIVAHRDKRKSDQGFLELYQDVRIRPQTDFAPYFERLDKCRK
jgi:hypothetical protein